MKYTAILGIWALLFSCKDDVAPEINSIDFYECHQSKEWEDAQIESALIGSWAWQQVRCNWSLDNGVDTTIDRGLTVELKSDKTFVVTKDKMVIESGDWEIQKGSDDIHTLSTDPAIGQLRGIVLICSEWVGFFNGYVDGCDNYFKKE